MQEASKTFSYASSCCKSKVIKQMHVAHKQYWKLMFILKPSEIFCNFVSHTEPVGEFDVTNIWDHFVHTVIYLKRSDPYYCTV